MFMKNTHLQIMQSSIKMKNILNQSVQYLKKKFNGMR